MSKYEKGMSLHEFVFTKAIAIEELRINLYQLQHQPTGAKVIHLKADDHENLFCFSFQTFPSDSTGVAHILEHTILCGSKKYPVKDPFFSMRRRSLSTFMNAMTGSDFTCYPAASQVERDFYNLMEVYLDALFFPELERFSFLQEGCRLEFENNDDPASPLIFKGVVFNEMKGSLSVPETRLWQEIMKELTPNLPYAFNAGGDPAEIPRLTHEQLKIFHRTYYHPSRCLFFFYGDLPLERHLEFITKRALKGFKKMAPLLPIANQPRFNKSHALERCFPPQNEGDKNFVALSWLTTHARNQEDLLSLSLLNSILMETDASLLKLPLLRSQLCTQADGYVSLEMSEIPYTIICRGCEDNVGKEIEKLILKTLEKIESEGINSFLINAALHQLEFHHLEISGDYAPFGLNLFFRSALAEQHGCPVEYSLSIQSQFKRVQLLAKDPKYFPQLIRKYLLDNPHRVTLNFSPNSQLQRDEEEQEKEKLKKIKGTLSEEAKKKIVSCAIELTHFQDKKETQSLECLPKIDLADIPQETPDFHLHQEQLDQLTIFFHDCFTNHITYAHLIFDLPYIASEDLPYVKLFLSLIPEIGSGGRDYRTTLEYINAYIGDFSTCLHLCPQVGDPDLLKPAFGLGGRVLDRNTGRLFTLFKDVCRSLHLEDSERIKELIFQIHTSLENKLNCNALSYAVNQALHAFNQSRFIAENWDGLTYFQFIRTLTHNLDEKLPHIIEKLKTIQENLFHFTTPHLILSCDADQYHVLAKEGFYGIGELSGKSYIPWCNHPLPLSTPAQARPISSAVAFSVFGFPAITISDPNSPALALSTCLLENILLHKKIREQGGAYGAGARYNPMKGTYYFYSYRDPHISATFDAFRESFLKVANNRFSDHDITEAKFGLIRGFDSPLPPGSRGMLSYHFFREGRHRELRQIYRDNLLNVQKKDMKQAVLKQLMDKQDIATQVSFASRSHLQKSKINLPIIPI